MHLRLSSQATMENHPIRCRLMRSINLVLLYPGEPRRVVLCIEIEPTIWVHGRNAVVDIRSPRAQLIESRMTVQPFELGRLLKGKADQQPSSLSIGKIP